LLANENSQRGISSFFAVEDIEKGKRNSEFFANHVSILQSLQPESGLSA
jgi:hypothetical protein